MSKHAEITPNAQKIDKIIKRVDDGDIKIPAFQRGYVWKQNQILELLESVYNEYPIGSVLLWKTTDKIKSTRNIAGYQIPMKDESYPVNYVLDGQQRIASLYGVFSEGIEQETDGSGYNPNLEIFEFYFDFETNRFLPKSEVVDGSSCIHLRHLLGVTRLIPALKELDESFHDDAQKLQSRFLNYEVPVVTIENRSREDVGIIFERINNTGTRLSALDLMTAWTWTDDFHLLEASDDFLEELDQKGFGNIKHKVLLQIISAVVKKSTITKTILSLSGEEVRDNWKNIIEATKRAVDFLATDLNCRHLDFLPFSQQLVSLTVFFDIVGKNPSPDQLKVLKHFFWKTSFSKRYSSGQTSAKMDVDIQEMIKLSKNDLSAFEEYEYTVDSQALMHTKFSKGNPITRAILLLMAQRTPRDLISGQAIDLSKALSHYNRKEYHHVFPNAFLKKQGKERDHIFCVLNFCFLTSNSNKVISKRSPSDYMMKESEKMGFDLKITSNMLPTNTGVYMGNLYEHFLEQRAELMLSEISSLTEN